MHKRILNIYLYRESDQLLLRFLDIYPKEYPISKSKEFTFVDMTERELDDIGEDLEWHWSWLNHYEPHLLYIDEKQLGFQPKYDAHTYSFDGSFLPIKTFSEEWYADPARKTFLCREICLAIPQTDETSLLKLLIGLDPFIRDYKTCLGQQYEIAIHYHSSSPQVSYTHNEIRDLFTGQQGYDEHDQPELSRFIANSLISQLSNQVIKDTLKELLASDQPWLTQVIRKKLYPESPVYKIIKQEYCDFYHDQAMSALLDSNISSKIAIDTLRKQLRTQSITSDKYRKTLSLESWYKRFEFARQWLWEDMIYNVIGAMANDGGMYTRRYTELKLLSEATFELKNGLMVLHFGHSPTYQRYYTNGKTFYNELENELRIVSDLMGLHFLPGQNFHSGEVCFDQQSTNDLMNCGFHITLDFCKTLVHAQHFYHLFNQVDRQDEKADPAHRINTPIQPL